jgi:hypothetical protein
MAAGKGANVDDSATLEPELSDRLLNGQNRPEHMVENSRLNSATDILWKGSNLKTPALFTSISSLPNAAFVSAKSRFTSSGSETQARRLAPHALEIS